MENKASQLGVDLHSLLRDQSLNGVATMGGFCWDIRTDELVCSPSILQVLEIERENYLSKLQHFMDCIYPEDLLAFEDEISEILGGRNELEALFRIISPSGIKRAQLNADVFRDDNGDAVAMDGFVRIVRHVPSERVLEMESLVSEAVHGVNNVLTSIMGSTSMASSAIDMGGDVNAVRGYLEEIENETINASVRLRRMVQHIKSQ